MIGITAILGLTFRIPCRLADTILSNFVRTSMDHSPYSFFHATKMVSVVSMNAAETPITTVMVKARNGTKEYKMVSNSSISNSTVNHH